MIRAGSLISSIAYQVPAEFGACVYDGAYDGRAKTEYRSVWAKGRVTYVMGDAQGLGFRAFMKIQPRDSWNVVARRAESDIREKRKKRRTGVSRFHRSAL
jgi:hypothetical protein